MSANASPANAPGPGYPSTRPWDSGTLTVAGVERVSDVERASDGALLGLPRERDCVDDTGAPRDRRKFVLAVLGLLGALRRALLPRLTAALAEVVAADVVSAAGAAVIAEGRIVIAVVAVVIKDRPDSSADPPLLPLGGRDDRAASAGDARRGRRRERRSCATRRMRAGDDRADATREGESGGHVRARGEDSGTFSQLGLRTAKKQYIKADSRQLAPPIERGERDGEAKPRLGSASADGAKRLEDERRLPTGRDATARATRAVKRRRRRTEGYHPIEDRLSSVHHAFPVKRLQRPSRVPGLEEIAGPKTAARVSVGKSASVFLLGRAPPARTTRRAGESRSHGDGRHARASSRRHGGRHAAHGQGTQPRRGGSDGGGGARDARLGVPAVPPMHPSVRGARGAARSGARRRAALACLDITP